MSAAVAELVRQMVEDTRQVAAWRARLSSVLAELQAAAGWTDAQLAEFMSDGPTGNPLLEELRASAGKDPA